MTVFFEPPPGGFFLPSFCRSAATTEFTQHATPGSRRACSFLLVTQNSHIVVINCERHIERGINVKKMLLAASVATAMLPVGAMAAPTFYGKLNLSVDKTSDYPEGALVFSQDDLSDAWFVSSNNSRLGVKGEELLYNDSLSVIYQMEVGYDADGDSSATFSTRNSFLGLGTQVGKIFAGRYDSVVKLAEGKIDQFNDTVADMDTVFLGQRRNSNSLNWESMDLGGIVVRAQIAPGEGETVGSNVSVSNPAIYPFTFGEDEKDGLTDTWGLSATFNPSSFFAALAYESSYTEFDFTTVALNPGPPPALEVVNVADIGADVDILRGSFGTNLNDQLQVGAIIERSEVDPYDEDEIDLMSYLVSARLDLDKRFAIKGQLAMLDSSDLELETKTLTVGADYQLGEQTIVYGLTSLADTDYNRAGSIGDVDESGMAFSVGMIHKF